MKGKIIKICAVLGCIVLAATAGSIYVSAKGAKKDVIYDGIYIGSINVGGMTVKKATNTLKKHVEEAKSETVSVKVDKHTVKATLEELGYVCDVDSFVNEAYNYGRTGDIIKRYKDKKDLEKDKVVIDLAFTLDDKKVKNFVSKKCTVYDVQAENAKLKRKNGKFKIIKEKNGRVIVAGETAEKIESVIAGQWIDGGITVEAIMNDTTPEYDSTTLEECQDMLGSYSTSFASSDSARSQNLVNAASLLNGITIYPGETFSVADHLVPFTVENGYQVSKAYASGQVVDSIGGGVCQAATTLYNTLLKAELEIVERHNHSMIVGYVEPSMDAAISEGSKDLKFKNNTEVPIYLEAYTANRSIYFNIYGKETRDLENRTVEYKSEVLEKIDPGEDKVTIDESLPEGYEEVTQSAHVGYKAQLWKIVYENGKQVSKDVINSSYYAAEPRYVTKGGKSSDSATEKPSDNNDNKNEKPTTAPSRTKKPQATKTPTVTKAPVVTKEPKKTKASVATKKPSAKEE